MPKGKHEHDWKESVEITVIPIGGPIREFIVISYCKCGIWKQKKYSESQELSFED